MPEVNKMSRNWLNLMFSVGMMPYRYLLVMFFIPVFEWARWCLAVKKRFLFVFREVCPALFKLADMKLSSVACGLAGLLELPRVGTLI